MPANASSENPGAYSVVSPSTAATIRSRNGSVDVSSPSTTIHGAAPARRRATARVETAPRFRNAYHQRGAKMKASHIATVSPNREKNASPIGETGTGRQGAK